MRKLKIAIVIIVCLILSSFLYQNYFFSSGYYYSKRIGDAEEQLLFKVHGISLSKNALKEAVFYKPMIVSKGVIFSKAVIPFNELNSVISQINDNYTKIYLKESEILMGADDIDHEKDPYLMGEVSNPYHIIEPVVNRWQKEDGVTIEYVLVPNDKSFAVYVCGANDDMINLYLTKNIFGGKISELEKSHFLRKWF